MTITSIEGKIPIAADAAELVLAYLDELNTKLNQAGVKNAYLIVSDVESMIIEVLQRQGKTTKLGNDEVLKIINEEFDDPDEFIKIYLADMNPEVHDKKVDRFRSDPNQRRLVRRNRKQSPKTVKTKKKKAIIPKTLRNIAALIPLIFILMAITFNLGSYFDNTYRYMDASFVLTIVSVAVFTMYEFITGLNGKLIVNINRSLLIRYSYRGFYISGIIITWMQYYRLYRIYISFPYYRNFSYFFASFQIILITYAALFVFTELMIFMRDHIPKFYPLEADFRPIIRFFTPPYLLVGSGILIFFLDPRYYENVTAGTIMVLVGILWAIIRNYKVSLRFYIVSIVFIFSTGIYSNYDEVFYVASYGFLLYLGYLALRYILKLRPRGGKGVIRKIKNQYSDYYNQ